VRPLSDLFVLDFSTLLPGPLATLLLAEAGARVIKIERPEGDDMRRYDPIWGTDSATFALLNRGKQSVALDLKKADARATLQPLIERADVIVEQFRPGVMARLRLDYESVVRVNPRVVYCSISAYGQTGPRRDVPGHDLNLLAETGILALSMGNPADVAMPPTPIADVAGGAYPAVFNILLALQERRTTGVGRYLDISLSDNLFTLAYWALAQGWASGIWPGNRSHLVTGASPRYRIYATRDGRAVAAAPLEQKFWENFCAVLNLRPQLRDDRVDPAATIREISEIIGSDTAQAWAARFSRVECCCSIVNDIQTAMEDPHFKARGLFGRFLCNELGVTIPALPVPIDPAFREAPGTTLGAPVLGTTGEPVRVPHEAAREPERAGP
jgi:crotonobetainyl-CoA:carnitine CoA-transferase CaiB-like acyl-CoA transferase